MATDWHKKTLAEILGEDRGLPDWAAEMVARFRPEDLDELHPDEREAATKAFARIARQSRDARGEGISQEPNTRPGWVDGDIDWGLRAARSALEARPVGRRSEKAEELLADCQCPPAAGPAAGATPPPGRADV